MRSVIAYCIIFATNKAILLSSQKGVPKLSTVHSLSPSPEQKKLQDKRKQFYTKKGRKQYINKPKKNKKKNKLLHSVQCLTVLEENRQKNTKTPKSYILRSSTVNCPAFYGHDNYYPGHDKGRCCNGKIKNKHWIYIFFIQSIHSIRVRKLVQLELSRRGNVP